MTDLANAAVAASIIVGMISIPAASQTVDTANSVQPTLGNTSVDKEIPKQESSELGPDSFTRSVESAFSSFRTEISSGEVQGKLENPQESLEIDSEPGKTKWSLKTPEGSLEVVETSTSVKKTASTPRGTLEVIEKNGGVSKSFEGSDRDSVEQTMEQLMEKLEQKQEEYRKKADSARIRHYRNRLQLEVEPETPEKVVITNSGDEEFDLSGWRVMNGGSDSHEIQKSLEPGQKLHVYSNNYAEKSEIEENSEDLYVYETGITWPDDGGEATLEDPRGRGVMDQSY